MSNEIEMLRKRLEIIDYTNRERLRLKIAKDNELNDLYNERDRLREKIETIKFIIKTSTDYYTAEREDNLRYLAEGITEFMENVLGKEYDVQLKIKRSGNYDYLDSKVNGVEPKVLSGGEQQVFSLAMVSECASDGVLVLDESINSLDPFSQEKIIYYLEKIAEDKQVVIIELDDNLAIPYTFIAENNTLVRGNLLNE